MDNASNPAALEVNPSDARDRASLLGEVIGCGDEREDGGWDFVVDTEEGEILVSVIRGDDGLLHTIAA